MDRFLIRTGGGGNKSSSSTGKGKNGKNLKKKKKTVLKEGTVKNWGKDWIQIDQKDSKLVIHCVACKLHGNRSVKRKRNFITSDPFIKGTFNVKKYAADRHESTKFHKDSYSKFTSFLIRN